MTGEEMERAIEFLLQSQANLEAQIAETNRIVRLNAETVTTFIQTVTRSLEAQDQINANLRAADARTDARLNKLIGLFEQHIIAGH
jgi:Glu-tRNA(Gln) amidotransferase subunit E-like FAD-binding protein